jgi:hypothetical protein
MAKKNLIFQEQFPVKSDDLKFDGKNIIIPSYYVDTLIDYVNCVEKSDLSEGDVQDYVDFRKFLFDVQKYKELNPNGLQTGK